MISANIIIKAGAGLLTRNPQHAGATMEHLEKYLARYPKAKRNNIWEKILDEIARVEGVERYRVTSATKLENPAKEKIAKMLGGNKADISHSTNPKLLGGYTIKTKGRMLDISLASRIEIIKQEVTSL